MIPLSPSFLFAFSKDSIPEGLILGVIQAVMTISLPPNHVRCCFQLRAQVSCALNRYENHPYLFKTNKSTKPPSTLYYKFQVGSLRSWGQWHNRMIVTHEDPPEELWMCLRALCCRIVSRPNHLFILYKNANACAEL